MDLYRKSFHIKADSYEVWESGRCLDSGACSVDIKAFSTESNVIFSLVGVEQLPIAQSFTFYYGDPDAELLPDRIQYMAMDQKGGLTPMVCNIFIKNGNFDYIRFATLGMNGFKLIEFHGKYVGCNVENISKAVSSASSIIAELKRTDSYDSGNLMEWAVRLFNDNAEVETDEHIKGIVEALKLFVEADKTETEKIKHDGFGRESSLLMPKILMFIASCNYKLGNFNSAYHIAKKGLKEIDRAMDKSPLTGFSREVFGESTMLGIVDNILNIYPEELQGDLEGDDIDETIIDTRLAMQALGCDTESNSADIEKKNFKTLVEAIDKVGKIFWDIGARNGDSEGQIRMMSLMDIFKNAALYSWEVQGFGHHSDFWKEGDSMFGYMMFEMKAKDGLKELVNVLETQSPFSGIEKNSAITDGLLKIYRKTLSMI